MTFLYPSFFWALALLAIPILIHLFNFRKTTRVYFSNNRFLKQVKEVTTAKRRLKHYLILASRLLFLFFLVIAFAQPLIPAQEQLGAGRSVVLYLDNSQSMTAQLEDKTRGLDAGLNFARNIVQLFPPDTRYKILTNDFAPFSNSYKTKTEALDILAQIRTSPVSRSMQEIRERAIQNTGNRAQEYFWVSDFQKSTLGVVPRWDTASRWHLVPIQFSSAPNVFVDSAYLENPFAASGEKNVLKVRVRNDGDDEVDQLNIKLTLNGIQAGTVTADIPAAGITETSFDLANGLSGLNKAIVTFNDFPVSFDNEFYLALNFTDKISIVEIKPSSATTPVEKVFGNKQIFEFKSFSVTNFNYNLLSQADLVIVNGIDQINASLSLSLRTFLDQSGSLFLIPGSKPDVSSYQSLTGLSNMKTLPGPGEMRDLDKPDFDNPFFENVFEERSASLSMPKSIRLIDWGQDRTAILKFRDDRPFLSRFDQQGGKLYLLATPLQTAFTDFYNHALFVPVMYRIAGSSKKSESRLYYTLQENFITVRTDSLLQDEPVKLIGNEEIVPAQRKVNNQVFMEIPKFTINRGFYNIVSKADTVNLVAFNLNKAESLLDQYTGTEIKNRMGGLPNITIFEAGSSEAFSNEIKARYLGKPLWKYALMLALFFLLMEVLLIRFLK